MPGAGALDGGEGAAAVDEIGTLSMEEIELVVATTEVEGSATSELEEATIVELGEGEGTATTELEGMAVSELEGAMMIELGEGTAIMELDGSVTSELEGTAITELEGGAATELDEN